MLSVVVVAHGENHDFTVAGVDGAEAHVGQHGVHPFASGVGGVGVAENVEVAVAGAAASGNEHRAVGEFFGFTFVAAAGHYGANVRSAQNVPLLAEVVGVEHPVAGRAALAVVLRGDNGIDAIIFAHLNVAALHNAARADEVGVDFAIFGFAVEEIEQVVGNALRFAPGLAAVFGIPAHALVRLVVAALPEADRAAYGHEQQASAFAVGHQGGVAEGYVPVLVGVILEARKGGSVANAQLLGEGADGVAGGVAQVVGFGPGCAVVVGGYDLQRNVAVKADVAAVMAIVEDGNEASGVVALINASDCRNAALNALVGEEFDAGAGVGGNQAAANGNVAVAENQTLAVERVLNERCHASVVEAGGLDAVIIGRQGRCRAAVGGNGRGLGVLAVGSRQERVGINGVAGGGAESPGEVAVRAVGTGFELEVAGAGGRVGGVFGAGHVVEAA